jgi:hypothetical protein
MLVDFSKRLIRPVSRQEPEAGETYTFSTKHPKASTFDTFRYTPEDETRQRSDRATEKENEIVDRIRSRADESLERTKVGKTHDDNIGEDDPALAELSRDCA